jgi:hypothetical protein
VEEVSGSLKLDRLMNRAGTQPYPPTPSPTPALRVTHLFHKTQKMRHKKQIDLSKSLNSCSLRASILRVDTPALLASPEPAATRLKSYHFPPICITGLMRNSSPAPDSSRRGWSLMKPSLADLFFPVLLLAAFGRVKSWQALLADGDTGWHIRTGDFILNSGTVPRHDLFSFSRAGQPWFAWEWLSDVTFALLHRWRGLEAVTGFSVIVICIAAVWLLRWLLSRGSGLWVAFPVTLAVISASSIHYLARPHIFSLLLATVMLWLLDRDRCRPGPLLWILVPLCALWTNLHGGFVCGLAILVLLACVCALERNWRAFRRYSTLAGFCSVATLLNPYGWHLHQHVVQYLRSSWIIENVQEFQSPNIRDENMQVFALLLLAGVALVSRACVRRQWFEGLLVLAWAFAAMRSARHVPLYALAAAPLIAQESAALWSLAARRRPLRSPVRIFWDLSQEFGRSRRMSLWTPAAGALALWMALPQPGIADFPDPRFPVAMVSRNDGRLNGADRMPRILTSDLWADYLIYRHYPEQRVFFDGRSDFYGPLVGGDYQSLLSAGRQWRTALERYRFEIALLPLDWPLASVLEHEPDWTVVDRDSSSLLLVRRGADLMQSKESAECRSVGK